MIGLGLSAGGFGGTVDQAMTAVGILGGDQYIGWLSRFERGWRAVDSAQDRASRSAAAMQRVGLGLTGAVTGSMIALGLSAIKSANNVIESENLVAVSFGKNTKQIMQWSEERRKALGFNSYDLRRQAADFNNLFKGAGMDPDKARDLAKQLVDAQRDAVSYFHRPAGDVQDAIFSGLAGQEREVRRFGVFMSEDALKQFAVAKGLAAGNKEMDERTKVTARAMFILQKWKDLNVIGDAERTKNSPANTLRRLQDEANQARADLGRSLIPVEVDLLKVANIVLPAVKRLSGWFAGLSESTRKWVVWLGLAGGPAVFLAGKILSIVNAMKALREARSLRTTLETMAGGKGLASSANVATMYVRAGIVYVNGPVVGGSGGDPGGGWGPEGGDGFYASGPIIPSALPGAVSPAALPLGDYVAGILGAGAGGVAATVAGRGAAARWRDAATGRYVSADDVGHALPSAQKVTEAVEDTPLKVLPAPRTPNWTHYSPPAPPTPPLDPDEFFLKWNPSGKVPTIPTTLWERIVSTVGAPFRSFGAKAETWWSANQYRPIELPFGGATTFGRALSFADKAMPYLSGALTGIDSYGDYRRAGYGVPTSIIAGMATGALVTGLTKWNPLTQVAVVAGGIIRSKWNAKLDQQDRVDERGTGLSDEQVQKMGTKNFRAKEKAYWQAAAKAASTGDFDSADSFRIMAQRMRKHADASDLQSKRDDMKATLDKANADQLELQKARSLQYPGLSPEASRLAETFGLVPNGALLDNHTVVRPKTNVNHDDSVTVSYRLPAGLGSADARRLRFMTSTPNPAF